MWSLTDANYPVIWFFPLIFCWNFFPYHKQFWDEHLFSIMSVHLFASLQEVELLSLRQCIFSGFLNQSASERPTLALQVHFKPEADALGVSDPSFSWPQPRTWRPWAHTLQFSGCSVLCDLQRGFVSMASTLTLWGGEGRNPSLWQIRNLRSNDPGSECITRLRLL